MARAEIVAFTDDDTIPDPGWLKMGLQSISPDVHAISGRIVMPIPEVPSDYERDASHLEDAEFAAANCMVRLTVLHSIGGFDERFTMAWREDSDLHFALLKGGYTLVRAASAIVVHPLRPGRFAIAIGMQRKIMFDTLLYKKYPELYRRRIRRGPPWFDMTVSVLLVITVSALITGRWSAAGAAGAVWGILTLYFCAKRLNGTRHDPLHIAETLITSVAIPPLSIFWRIVGSLRFGKGFP